jgi:hypothetical protein
MTQQLLLDLSVPHQAHVDRLVAAGHTAKAAHRLLALFIRCEFDIEKALDDHDRYLAEAIAICEHCGLTWSVETPLAWWLKYDRCYSCMRDVVLDDDRCLTADEQRPFLAANPPAPLPRSDPRRLP